MVEFGSNPDEVRLSIMKGEILVGSPEEIEEKSRIKFGECFERIILLLKKYADLPEEYYPLITLWILGTYLHNEFETYPLLFINATKGSGKSRLLRLISALSKNGKTVLDLREAVLFRTAKDNTLAIDEFEGVGSKESGTLRTMINASYKKGTAVERIKKIKNPQGQEEMKVERFDLYTPVVMANIWGMEDVLSDRCLTIILDKSDKKIITKLIEDFERNPEITQIKSSFNQIQCSLCSVVTKKNIINSWNNYIIDKYTTTHTTLHTYNTLTTLTTQEQLQDLENLEIFNKIDATDIDGRNLELFFPLLIISKMIGDDIFESTLTLAKKMITEKKSEEFAESRDVALIDFISKKESWTGSYLSIHDICQEFRLTIAIDPDEEKWLNPKWIGRALKRSKLIIQKRRVGKGIECLIDISKAKEQLKRFKEVKHE